MTKREVRGSLGLVGATAAYLASAALGWPALGYAAKPLIVVACLVLAAGAPPARRRWIVAGLVCSLGGDVALMLPGDYFVPGLALFLVAHVCYIRALTLDAWRMTPVPGLVVGGYLMLMVTLLVPSLGPMRVPVVLYASVISVMAWQALERAIAVRGAATTLMAVGAVLFVCSDTSLAINRFLAPVPMERVLIMGTYALAQWGIALGASRERR
jgi:uncharacterized membrane protein YhhN